MHKTVEKILAIIGIAVDLLCICLGFVVLVIAGSSMGLIESALDQVGLDFLRSVIGMFIDLLWVPIISCFISMILGIIGVLKIRTNPKLAGGFFIAAAVLSCWLLITGFSIQSVLYAVAGIMCLVINSERR